MYIHYDEFDNAALAMMERSPFAWEHNQFKEVVAKVANIEIYYKVTFVAAREVYMKLIGRKYLQALTFYLQEQPMLLNDLLVVLAPRVDHTRVVRMFQKADELPSKSRSISLFLGLPLTMPSIRSD